jgi:hypothetical protein
MSSETLTESAPREPGGISAWQFFLLLGMLGATVAVVLSQHTQPAALLLLSAAVVSVGLVAIALHRAFGALLGREGFVTPRPTGRDRALLEADKALVLRSIKELEFDRAMGKMGEADFQELSTRLRARAIGIMQQLDNTPGSDGSTGSSGSSGSAGKVVTAGVCGTCGTVNDVDARFCKQCGGKLA